MLPLRSGTGSDDPKAVGLEQYAENVPKSLIVLDQENDMHRIGHEAILIHHRKIRREDAKFTQNVATPVPANVLLGVVQRESFPAACRF
jgi:hypothetical protein